MGHGFLLPVGKSVNRIDPKRCPDIKHDKQNVAVDLGRENCRMPTVILNQDYTDDYVQKEKQLLTPNRAALNFLFERE